MTPFEGALALEKVLLKLDPRPRKVSYEVAGMFGSQQVEFRHIPIQFSNGDTFEVPWGEYDMEFGNIRCSVSTDDDMPCFSILGLEINDPKAWEFIVENVKLEKVNLYRG